MGTGPYVWLIADTEVRWLWKDFAHFVSRRTGLDAILLVSSEQDRTFYTRQYGETPDFEVVLRPDPYPIVLDGDPAGRSPQTIRSRSRQIEQLYDISLMRDVVLMDRHLGRGYMLAGKGHPESIMSRAVTHDGVLAACVYQFDSTEALFDRYPPTLVLSHLGGTGLRSKPIAVMCRHRNVPVRALCPTRFGSLVYWADDEFQGSTELMAHLSEPRPDLAEIEADMILSEMKLTVTVTNPAARAALKDMFSLRGIAKHIVLFGARLLYARIRRYRRARFHYLFMSYAAFLLRQRRHLKVLDRIALRVAPEENGCKVVYFPLQQEPEAATLALSPKHTNQLATILELSLALPADATLAVKEHVWQLGRRTEGFYEALLEMPNVVLIHPLASSFDLIRRSSLVATITSSAGFEAAVMGKPVVFFWDRCPLPLDHVHDMTRFKDLERIVDMLDDDPEAEAKRRRDGAMYLKKLSEFCLDLESLEIYGREFRPTEVELEILSASLLTELGLTRAA